jgi:hypothetical protein
MQIFDYQKNNDRKQSKVKLINNQLNMKNELDS